MRYVLYHDKCNDGFGAAYVAWRHFKKDAQYLPVKHGESIPFIKNGAEVYIVDFSYPREDLLTLNNRVSKLVVLDHHISAQRELSDLDFVIFDMERSGAGITWDYFNPGKDRPWLINHIEDRDLWRFNIEGTNEIHTYLVASNLNFEELDSLCHELQHDALRRRYYDMGGAMLKYKSSINNAISNFSYLDKFAGYIVPMVNSSCSRSDLGHLLLEKYTTFPFSVVYWDRSDGYRQFSLRSNGFDVSKICKKYGGGGHKQAAGFQLKLKNLNILTSCVLEKKKWWHLRWY